jgi:hypothetical protein
VRCLNWNAVIRFRREILYVGTNTSTRVTQNDFFRPTIFRHTYPSCRVRDPLSGHSPFADSIPEGKARAMSRRARRRSANSNCRVNSLLSYRHPDAANKGHLGVILSCDREGPCRHGSNSNNPANNSLSLACKFPSAKDRRRTRICSHNQLTGSDSHGLSGGPPLTVGSSTPWRLSMADTVCGGETLV